uniref:5'-nucleotidase n=1 Tax=Glyptapanteles indiensis TaxID=92994 RepID=A0JCT4_GLYIN|nr:5' nucleotidase, putative [Glyptapanteles indiensis]
MKSHRKLRLLLIFVSNLFVNGLSLSINKLNDRKIRENSAVDNPGNGEWRLRIVHTNDMHSRFNQTSKSSTDCSEKDAKKEKCYGGFARIASKVREINETSTSPVLFLNAGDNFFGTPWFDIHREKIVLDMMNLLKPDAMSLGNHEFEHGPQKLVPFINNVSAPVLCCNLDMSKEPELQNSKLLPYVELSVRGHRVGIIGYLTRETMDVAQVDNVKVLDEIDCLRKNVKELKDKGVDIIIGLGHSGYVRDLEIAKAVEGLDLIVGGHTNTFLHNGPPPDQEKPEGPYPTVVVQPNGRKVYVVQAYAYTKYLGDLEVTFDAGGEITHVEGNPILINHKVPEANDVVKALDNYRKEIQELGKKVIGETLVPLDGPKRCKMHECNSANLLADAMVDYVSALHYLEKDKWTDAAVAIVNSGSFKSEHEAHTNVIVYSIIVYDEIMVTVDFTGKQLLEAFEHGVVNITYNDVNRTDYVDGRLLQVSGIKVRCLREIIFEKTQANFFSYQKLHYNFLIFKISYDLLKPGGSKVIPNSVSIRCADCQTSLYKPLDENKTYKVLTGDFLRRGEDGFTFIKDLPWQSSGRIYKPNQTNFKVPHVLMSN